MQWEEKSQLLAFGMQEGGKKRHLIKHSQHWKVVSKMYCKTLLHLAFPQVETEKVNKNTAWLCTGGNKRGGGGGHS